MRSLLSRSKPARLDESLDALRTIVELGRGRLEPEGLDAARVILDRGGERLGLGAAWTVVALAGSTGSGKSSLFNALTRTDLSDVGVRRPTTAVAHAAVWADEAPSELLDWLAIPRRHHISGADLDGLVLLDLPDHDSTATEHRLEVDRLVALVDVFVWVVDPQKYADSALHDGYLRPLASHAAVTVVVLNQIDRLSEAERRQCLADVSRLLDADGLANVLVVSTSALTGVGIDELRGVIATRVKEERAARERIRADLVHLAARFDRYCSGAASELTKGDLRDLEESLADAARVDVVTDAVARTHRRDAVLSVGWPFTRWLRRLRPDPLARLHLGRPGGAASRTSLGPPTQLQRAEVESALRAVSQRASQGLPSPWPETIHERVGGEVEGLLEDLDRAVSRADLGAGSRPLWWSAASALQTILATAAVFGFLWLTVLFVLQWLQIPRPPTPQIEEIPWPTILLVGGLAAGSLLAFVFGVFARFGASRRARRARTRIVEQVDEVARERVLQPIQAELAARSSVCAAVSRLRG